MKDTTAAIPAGQPQRGYFTPTDGFYGIGAWGYYLEGESWNGWSVPYFTLADCQRLATEVTHMCIQTGDTDTRISVPATGAFPAWFEDVDGKPVRHEMASLEIKGAKYYALGGHALTWGKVHTEHRDDLARLGELGAGEWVEIAFEALNGWHASIDTDDDMGLQMSSTLNDIADLARFVETNSPHLGDPLTYWQQADAYAIGCDWLDDYTDQFPEIWERVAAAWSDKWDAPARVLDSLQEIEIVEAVKAGDLYKAHSLAHGLEWVDEEKAKWLGLDFGELCTPWESQWGRDMIDGTNPHTKEKEGN